MEVQVARSARTMLSQGMAEVVGPNGDLLYRRGPAPVALARLASAVSRKESNQAVEVVHSERDRRRTQGKVGRLDTNAGPGE